MKYPTGDESKRMVDQLEKQGFDLEDWERLERKKLLVNLGVKYRMGDEGFDLMDYRQMIADANELVE